MSTIDNRVVRMVFDNSKFKSAAAATKASLDQVTQSVVNAGKSRGLLDLGKSMDQIVGKSKTMQIAAVTAIGTISNKLTNAALSAGKSLLFDPIKQGFNEYGELLTKQNVIQNATGKSAKVVKGVLEELNTYSDKTIYSFGDMTQALTQFVNAGIPLKKATVAIQGISNAAAFSGATALEAQSAYRGFSDAMGVGFIGLQDWMQIRTAHMDTIGFKTELIKSAEAVGTLTKKGDHWVTKNGKFVSATKGFKDSLKEGWASTEAMTGAMTAYTKEGTKLGDAAIAAAKKVRTYSAFMSTLKESIGSGWAQVFGAMFGGLDDATKMWTNLSLTIGKVVSGFFDFLTASLKVWRAMGGAAKIGQAIKNVFSPFVALFKAIGDAFHAAFGGKGGKGAGSTLYALSFALELLTRPLTWLAKLIGLLVHPLTIFFKIIKGGIAVVGNIVEFIKAFAKAIWDVATFKTPSTGGFWDFVQKVGGWAVDAAEGVQQLIDKAQILIDKFQGIDVKKLLPEMPKFDLPGIGKFDLGGIFGGGDKKKSPLAALTGGVNIKQLTSDMDGLKGSLSGGLNIKQLTDNMDGLKSSFSGLNLKQLTGNMDGMSEGVKTGNTNIKQLTDNMDGYLTPAMDKVSDAGSGLWDVVKKITSAIGDFFGKIEGEDVVSSLNFAVLATMGLTFVKVFKSFSGIADAFKGIGAAAESVLKSTSNAIDNFGAAAKRESQAHLIMSIAIALGILAVSLWLLSRIPADKLTTALMALGYIMAGFSLLIVVLTKAVDKMDGKGTTGKLFAIGFALVGIGIGVLLLAAAFKVLESVGLGAVIKGLVTIGVVFAGLIAIGNLAEKSARKIVAAGVSMILIGAALIMLAFGLQAFSKVSEEDLQKAGMVFGALVGAILLMGKIKAATLAASALVFMAMAVSMTLLAFALQAFSKVSVEDLWKAGAALAGLTLAVILINKVGGGSKGAMAIVALGAGMVLIAQACVMLQNVSWETVGMAGVILLGLIVAFTAFLFVIRLFAPEVALLTGLAGSMALMAGAAALLAFAIALIIPLLGVAAVGIVVFASAAAVAIATFLQTLAAEMPNIKKSLDKILKVFVQFLVDSVPVIVQGIIDIIDAITEKVPDFVRAGVDLIVALIGGIGSMLAGIIEAAVELVIKFVDGLIDSVDRIRDAAVKLIVKLIEGIADGAIDILNAGVKLIADFLHALANTIRTGSEKIGAGITDVVNAMKEVGGKMVGGLVKGLADIPGKVVGAIKGLFGRGKKAADEEVDAHSPSKVYMRIGQFMIDGLTIGIQSRAAAAINAIASVMKGQISIAGQYASKFVQSMDQKAISARANAEGLSKAADIASTAANKTKSKKDDDEATALKERADRASEKADAAEEKADRAKAAADRKVAFKDATTLEKAKMKSEDAASALDEAKRQEGIAAKNLIAAKALEKLSKGGLGTPGGGGGSSAAQRSAAAAKVKSLQKQLDNGFLDESTGEKEKVEKQLAVQKKIAGDKGKAGDAILTAADRRVLADEARDLREDAKKSAAEVNRQMGLAKKNAADALAYQKKAGAEAAASFQKQFDAEAKADKKEAAFAAMTDEQKKASRLKDAIYLEKKAKEDLVKAKKLAYTDIEAANALAEKAMAEADRARGYRAEALDLEKAIAEAAKQKAEDEKKAEEEKKASGPAIGMSPLDLTASDAAAIAFNRYSDLYSAGSAAAAAGTTIEFKQYNTSPESLTPTEIYRQTNNLLTHASDKLGKAA